MTMYRCKAKGCDYTAKRMPDDEDCPKCGGKMEGYASKAVEAEEAQAEEAAAPETPPAETGTAEQPSDAALALKALNDLNAKREAEASKTPEVDVTEYVGQIAKSVTDMVNAVKGLTERLDSQDNKIDKTAEELGTIGSALKASVDLQTNLAEEVSRLGGEPVKPQAVTVPPAQAANAAVMAEQQGQAPGAQPQATPAGWNVEKAMLVKDRLTEASKKGAFEGDIGKAMNAERYLTRLRMHFLDPQQNPAPPPPPGLADIIEGRTERA